MKNISKLMSFVAIATLFFVGCNKENSINEQGKQDVVLNLDVNVSDDANTKAKYKTGWVEGDKLYLLFANNMFEYEPANYVEATYTSAKTWKITKGQEILNGLKKSGNVDICYCSGTPSNNSDGRGYVENNYPAQATSDPGESAFFFNPWSWQEGYTDTTPRLTLIIPINGKDYTMVKSLTNLDLTINQCYSVKGPSASDAQIEAAAKNDPLGNNWIKM